MNVLTTAFRGGKLLPAGLAAIAATAFLMAPIAPASAQKRASGWDNLGCTDVGRRPDFDVIEVGRREGTFRAIRIEVSGNNVHVNRIRVIYGNGKPDDMEVRSEFREGTQSRALDLQGGARNIRRIEIVSRIGKGSGRGRGRICVAGLDGDQRGQPPSRQPPSRKNASWEQLGCQKVNIGLGDRDSIRVSRREGRFSAIRVEVSGDDVFMQDLTVVYGNGSPDTLRVNQMIRENTRTGPLDLKGRERFIERIDMVYRTKLNFQGRATVCVFGLQR